MDEANSEKVKNEYRSMQPRYAAFGRALSVLLQQLCDFNRIAYQFTESREKSIESLVNKLEKNQSYKSISNITDLCGVRIVLFYQSDVEAVRALIRDEFEVVEEERHGLEVVQAFGYQSLHLIVRLHDRRKKLTEWQSYADLLAEIQVRSVLSHAWAAISHELDYKHPSQLPDESRRKLFRVAALLETGDDIFDAFRQEVERLRGQYAEEARQDSWADVELNLDSVVAAIQAEARLPIKQLEDLAIEAGFAPTPVSFEDYPESQKRSVIGRLVTVARGAGYETIGDLAAALPKDLGEGDLHTLQQMEQAIEKEGFKPWAIGPDVLALLIVLDNPQLFDDSAFEFTFKPQVTNGLKKLSRARTTSKTRSKRAPQ